MLVKVAVMSHILNCDCFVIVTLNKVDGLTNVEFLGVITLQIMLCLRAIDDGINKEVEVGYDKGTALVVVGYQQLQLLKNWALLGRGGLGKNRLPFAQAGSL